MTLHYFSSFLQPWLLPPGINILLLLIGLFLYLSSRKASLFVTAFGIATLWLLSTPFVAYHLIGSLQTSYTMLQPDHLKNATTADAIIVLGGGDAVEAEYGNKHTVSDVTLHRLQYAAYLQNKTHLPIIVSGGKYLAYPESEADLMAGILQDTYHVTVAFKEDNSMNTADEGKYLATLLKQHHLTQVYLVTNAWHMPRSVYIFQHSGIQVTPAPMGYYVYGPGYAFISFLPNIDALKASAVAMHEYIGWLWYYIS